MNLDYVLRDVVVSITKRGGVPSTCPSAGGGGSSLFAHYPLVSDEAGFIFQKFGVRSMRQLMRIDAVRRSPINSHVDESLVGATSIRAFGAQERFTDKMSHILDDSQSAYFLSMTTSS